MKTSRKNPDKQTVFTPVPISTHNHPTSGYTRKHFRKLPKRTFASNAEYQEYVKKGKKTNPSNLHIIQVAPRVWAVFLRNLPLKKFPTKLAAERYLNSIRARAKNPAEELEAHDLAEQALELFDLDNDADVDAADVELFDEYDDEDALYVTENKSGDVGEILSATADGDLIVEYTEADGDTHIEVEKPENVTILDGEPERIENGVFSRFTARHRAGRALKKKLRHIAAADRASLDLDEYSRLAKENPIHPLAAFAQGASGILSAIHIKQAFDKQPKKKTPAKTAAKKKAKNPSVELKSLYNQQIKKAKESVELSRRALAKKLITKATHERTVSLSKKLIADAQTGLKRNPPKTTIKTNPAARKLYEEFQGRKSSEMKPMPVSRLANGKHLDQLGDLVEIILESGRTINLTKTRNGKPHYPFKLTGEKKRNGKFQLWITGGKFAKPNTGINENAVVIVEPIHEITYGTRKPHLGDDAYTHYFHQLGEESGITPELGVDVDGYPVIKGGNYAIEARGIVD